MKHFPSLRSTPRSVRVGIVIVLAIGTIAPVAGLADPGPTGPAYPAEDRALPSRGWWQSCGFADGTTVSVQRRCDGEQCEEPANLFVQRRDGDGGTLGSPVQVTDAPALMSAHRVSCHAAGSFVVQWRDGETGCYHHRVFGADGRPSGAPTVTAEGDDCEVRRSVAVRESGAFVAVWTDDSSPERAIHGQRFGSGGDPAGDSFAIGSPQASRHHTAKVAVDDTGTALVVWCGRRLDADPGAILARFLDAGDRPLASQFRLDTFGLGVNASPTIVAQGGGVFEVLWSNPLQGGRVGRRVSLGLGAPTTTTTTTTVPRPPEMPIFGSARIIDSFQASSAQTRRYGIVAGAGSTWVVQKRYGPYRRSGNDGVSWDETRPVDPAGPDSAVLATDGVGNWMALHPSEDGTRLDFRRSSDDALSWHGALPLADWAHEIPGCSDCEVPRVDLAASEAGTWVAAWSLSGSGIERIYAAHSSDGSRWQTPVTIARDLGSGVAGFDVETDGKGTWLVMWADGELKAARSTDDGRTWSAPDVLARDLVCVECPKHRRYARVDLAHDDTGAWVVVFASPLYDADRYGYDGDVFALRSTDGGASWSEPTAVTGYADRDGVREVEPSIATDGSGRWLAAWTSHRSSMGVQDMDGDVVVALSQDGGATWSDPYALQQGAVGDRLLDWSPDLAADSRGIWMATWQSRAMEAVPGSSGDRILVAAADATCGDGNLDVGEQCDDGNADNDDGCDANCTSTGCGNGIVTATEGCDDGNDRENDACPNDCLEATCGDGFTRPGREECDYADPVVSDICSEDCRIVDVCGDADGDDEASVSDALRILRYSVGVGQVCPLATCDMNGDGSVLVGDARMDLLKAVGLETDEQCSLGSGRLVFWTLDSRSLGSLQLEVEYAPTGGRFLGSGGAAACETLAFTALDPEADNDNGEARAEGSGFAAYNNDLERGTLAIAFVSLAGFSGPGPLARCAFELPEGAAGGTLHVRVVDASDPHLNPVWPPVRVGYSLEQDGEPTQELVRRLTPTPATNAPRKGARSGSTKNSPDSVFTMPW